MLNLQTIVISLLRSPHRREKAQSELAKTTLKWSFLDAIDGSQFKQLPQEYPSKKVKRLQGYDLTPNEIGCYLSHMKAWQMCIDNNQTTLIFEDDFILLPEFEETLSLLLSEFQEWQMIRLQALVSTHHQLIKAIKGISIVQNDSDPLGATAYLIKPEAARTLLEHSKSIFEPLDHFLEHKEKHGLQILAAKPYSVDISEAPTTISDRPNDRKSVLGLSKTMRSVHRFLDRKFSKDPWFPK